LFAPSSICTGLELAAVFFLLELAMPSAAMEATSVAVQADETPLNREAIEAIRQALRGLRYGQIVVIVQDGVVVQVDRTERKRLRGDRRD
jgi:hypothetical protein